MFTIGDKVVAKEDFIVDGVDILITKGTRGICKAALNQNMTIVVHFEGQSNPWQISSSYISLYMEESVPQKSPKSYDSIQDYLVGACKFAIDQESGGFFKWIELVKVTIPFSEIGRKNLTYYKEKAKANGWEE